MAGKGTPSSQKCLSKFVTHWVSWAGWPKVVTTDRGIHNKGIFTHTLEQNAHPVEAPLVIGSSASEAAMIMFSVLSAFVVPTCLGRFPIV